MTRVNAPLRNLNRLRANAVGPIPSVIETIVELQRTKKLDPNVHPRELFDNYRKGVNGGLLKDLLKMGHLTLQSYHGAQIFEALGNQQISG
ncbi:hypothetical protein O9992_11990 [Vibrio lentus]|nr:hypothetical protein [Vibrio lentus]